MSRTTLRRHRIQRPVCAASVVWLATLGLLLSQWLAIWHEQAHGGHRPDGPMAAFATQPGHDEASCSGHDAWGHSEGDAECRLVDQLLVAMAGPPAAWAALPVAAEPARPPACNEAAWASPPASFQARAPPHVPRALRA